MNNLGRVSFVEKQIHRWVSEARPCEREYETTIWGDLLQFVAVPIVTHMAPGRNPVEPDQVVTGARVYGVVAIQGSVPREIRSIPVEDLKLMEF